MKKNISAKIKTLISDNKIEEALDLLISIEQTQRQERYHTLVLLKGKLEMIEEQELAGVLDFDELAQQKLRISHAILKMADDDGTDEKSDSTNFKEKNGPQKSDTISSPTVKYLLWGGLTVVALLVVYNLAKPVIEEAPPTLPQQEVEKQNPVNDEPTTSQEVKKQNPTTQQQNPTKEEPSPPPPIKKETASTADQEKAPATEKPPVVADKDDDILLNGFPKVNTTYSLGDTKFTFKEVKIRRVGKASAASPPKLELTFSIDLYCRTNLDKCDRPAIRLLVDGQAIDPAQHNRSKTWLAAKKSVVEELTFVFNMDNPMCRIQLEKYGSDWTRGFKILL